MKKAKLYTGEILAFPDGTADSVVEKTVKRHIAEKLASRAGLGKVMGHDFMQFMGGAFETIIDVAVRRYLSNSKGDIGETGPQGEQGFTGEQGEQGERGERGEKGDTGKRGERGEKGDLGERGFTGEKGDRGERGERGIGEKGEKGDRGEKGEKGDRGSEGPIGPAGGRGRPGAFWRGSWTAGVSYNDYDAVEYNGSSYVCTASNVTAPPPSEHWQIVASGAASGEIAWDDITEKPSTFTPTTHTHPLSALTASNATPGQVASWNGTAWVPTTPAAAGVSSVAGRTGAVTLSASDVSGLATVATSGAYADLTGTPPIQTFDQSLNTTDAVTFGNVLSGANVVSPFITTAFETGISLTENYLKFTATGSGFVNSKGAFAFNGGTGDLQVCKANGQAPQSLYDTGNLPSPAVKNANNNFTAGQTIATGTITTPFPALALTQTWNAAAQTFSAMTVNITDTSSNASSLLCDFQVGSVSRFNVDKNGAISTGWDTTSLTSGLSLGVPNFERFVIEGSSGQVTFARLPARGAYTWTSGYANGSRDLFLYRDAANTLALRNGARAQTFRLYGTYTDASNARRLDITSTTAGIFTLTATGNGTGASGNLLKVTAPILIPSASVTLATNGDLAFEATSNTSLTVRYRGSDGTTRSAVLTLA